MGYIRFLKTRTARRKGSREWSLMVRFQREMPEEFMKSYCYRVVIEGILSAMKNIFGVVIRSRKRHNQDVEVLSRLVLWNYMNIGPEEFRVNTALNPAIQSVSFNRLYHPIGSDSHKSDIHQTVACGLPSSQHYIWYTFPRHPRNLS